MNLGKCTQCFEAYNQCRCSVPNLRGPADSSWSVTELADEILRVTKILKAKVVPTMRTSNSTASLFIGYSVTGDKQSSSNTLTVKQSNEESTNVN